MRDSAGKGVIWAVWDVFTESAALGQGLQVGEGGPTLATAAWDMLAHVLTPGP